AQPRGLLQRRGRHQPGPLRDHLHHLRRQAVGEGAMIMRVFRILLATLAVGLGGLAAAPRAAAAVHCVAPPAVSSCPQHTIGSALVLAAPGDTILLAPGTYYESSIEIPSGLDGLTISGASKAATILDIGNNTALGVVSTSVGFRVHSRK